MLKTLLPAAVLGLALAACGESTPAEAGPDAPAPAAGRYTIEIVGLDGQALHYVRGADGRSAALSTYENAPGSARLLHGNDAGRAFREALGGLDLPDSPPSDVSLSVPGASFAANGDSGGQGQVALSLNLPDGQRIALNAGGGQDGDAAHIVLANTSADDTVDFIDDIDDAPLALREEMKDALGL